LKVESAYPRRARNCYKFKKHVPLLSDKLQRDPANICEFDLFFENMSVDVFLAKNRIRKNTLW